MHGPINELSPYTSTKWAKLMQMNITIMIYKAH